MTVVLIVLALAQPACIALVFRYLAGRDAAERAEREDLLVRITHPEVAQVKDARTVAAPARSSHLPFGDDTAWTAYQNQLIQEAKNGRS